MSKTIRLVAAGDTYTHNADVGFSPEWDETMLQPASSAAEPSFSIDPPVAVPVLAQTSEQGDPPAATWRKEFEFPGVLALVAEHREQVMEFVSEHCLDYEMQLDLLVAVQEALANAALHGCQDDPSKMIQCVVSGNATELTISVRDPGPGFT